MAYVCLCMRMACLGYCCTYVCIIRIVFFFFFSWIVVCLSGWLPLPRILYTCQSLAFVSQQLREEEEEDYRFWFEETPPPIHTLAMKRSKSNASKRYLPGLIGRKVVVPWTLREQTLVNSQTLGHFYWVLYIQRVSSTLKPNPLI